MKPETPGPQWATGREKATIFEGFVLVENYVENVKRAAGGTQNARTRMNRGRGTHHARKLLIYKALEVIN